MIDRKQISLPSITFSQAALMQLKLIIENDFTLAGKYLLLLISGKGCDGFSYGVGFTNTNEDDFLVPLKNDTEVFVTMDPFTSFYLQEAYVDYQTDFENNQEGFVVTNQFQDSFSGKFWKKDVSKVPPMTQLNS